MADILVEDRYRFDLNADAAIKEIAKLANEVDQYSDALDKAKASGKSFDAEQKALEASARKLNTVINQEVKTLDGINAKRNLLRGTLSNLTGGSLANNANKKTVFALGEYDMIVMGYLIMLICLSQSPMKRD